jgi:hypothetical protein
VGILTEGARFHTHALLRPFRSSPLATDAASIASQIATHIETETDCGSVKEAASA